MIQTGERKASKQNSCWLFCYYSEIKNPQIVLLAILVMQCVLSSLELQ